jgi:hypothetical protein
MGGVAKWPLLVPLFRDDPVAQHMVEARNCLKTWDKPALIMFGDEGEFTRVQSILLRLYLFGRIMSGIISFIIMVQIGRNK